MMRLAFVAAMLVTAFSVGAARAGANDDGGVAEPLDSDRVPATSPARIKLRQAVSLQYEKHIVDALTRTREALALAKAAGDSATESNATELLHLLEEQVAHVTFKVPRDIEDLQVSFDDRPVPADALTKHFTIDPGGHTVRASGHRAGEENGRAFEQDLEVAPGESVTVDVILEPVATRISELQICAMLANPDDRCARLEKCHMTAMTNEEHRACDSAANLARSRSCGACEIGRGGPPPRWLPLFVLAAAARRFSRRRRSRSRVRPRGRH